MTTTTPRPYTPTERPTRRSSAWINSVLAPVAAGVATICVSTALIGVIAGVTWLGYLTVVVVLVACTGLALRSLRTPTLIVGLVQLVVLALLVTGLFTRGGFAAVVPTPTSVAELGDVLAAAAEHIRTGLPPVPATPPILCLVTIALGVVAILVDTLAVAAAAPAATGLVLLCVYAVPASLTDGMLPWWTFALGAAGFAGLLAMDGNHRHRLWGNRRAPGTGRSPTAATTPVVVVCLALVCGLLAGSAITGVGTAGRLPGANSDTQGASSGGLGVNPFTSLRGMLNQGDNTELFRVRGLGDEKRLLRAFTLDTYRPNKGWGLSDGPMPAGVPANRPLPSEQESQHGQQPRDIEIEPVNWVDVWLPVYGTPRLLQGISNGWFYDSTIGTVFSERKQRAPTYTESAWLDDPSKEELRAADSSAGQIPPVYTSTDGVDPRVAGLAEQLTQNKANNFDKATAIWQYFTAQNGFTYDTQTASATDADALSDFLFNGKRGYCEQFASAMGIMLRTLDIPARVAIGFTSGYPSGDHRTITSQDAHAWVEGYFGDLGWVSFDPTPLTDGRGFVPSYLQADAGPSSEPSAPQEDGPSAPAPAQPPTGVASPPQADQPQARGVAGAGTSAPGWVAAAAATLAVLAAAASLLAWHASRRRSEASTRMAGEGAPGESQRTWVVSAVTSWLPAVAATLWVGAIGLAGWLLAWWFALALAVVIAVAAAPAITREVGRRRRLRAITLGHPDAADAAWQELLDESVDRGSAVTVTETARTTAQRIARRYQLDDQGSDELRNVVSVVERSWYGADKTYEPALAGPFERFRHSLRRNWPLPWRRRLLPRSLLRRKR